MTALGQETHHIRRDDPYWHTECDWGYCDGIATWWRWWEKHGYFLPVCGACAFKAEEVSA